MKSRSIKSTCGKIAALAVVAVVARAYAYEAKPGASPCVLAERGAAEVAVLDAVKASCRRQLGCCDERIREVVRFSEALVGESDAADRSADEWQKANDERAERLVATQRDDGSWPDVDYVNMTRSMFNAVRHLYNMRAIARTPPSWTSSRSARPSRAYRTTGASTSTATRRSSATTGPPTSRR